jgi:hypothetical protein
LEAALRAATSLDVAAAFVTQAGVDFFLHQLRHVPPDHCRLSVSVQFPTDLKAMCQLSDSLGDNLHIHLGSDRPLEKSGRSSPLMHSKVVWVGKRDGEVTIFVGSHNWTSTALDGVNIEASVRVESREDEPFATAVKTHLDACFEAGVRFDPTALAFYRAIQARLYPDSPRRPVAEAIAEFTKVPRGQAVVIHAEDHRHIRSPDLLVYLPMGGRVPHEWFNTVPTTLYLYLYPRGTLLEHRPPRADPSFFEGTVEYFSRTRRPGEPVDAQIRDLTRPVLTTVRSGSMPSPTSGVTAQAVADLQHRDDFPLPIYSRDVDCPGVRIDADFVEVSAEESKVAATGERPLLTKVQAYYAKGSISHGRFVCRSPRPVWRTVIQLPGRGLYRESPAQAVRAVLRRRYQDVEPEVEEVKSPLDYIYLVHFVLLPPMGTHGNVGSLFG